MANRIIINNEGMKISGQGVDVLTAELPDLLFDSDWSFPPIVASGSIYLTSNKTHTFTYSKTYVAKPLLLLLVEPDDTHSTWETLGGGYCVVGDSRTLDGDVSWYYFEVTSTQFEYTQSFGDNVTIHYRLFDLDLA